MGKNTIARLGSGVELRWRLVSIAALVAAAMLFLLVPVRGQGSLWDGLAAYWSMDEENGTREDTYGSADFLEIGATVSSTSGVLGNAADFVAVGHLSSAATVINPVSFTVSLWMTPTGDFQFLLSAQDDNTLDGVLIYVEQPYVTFCLLEYPATEPCLQTTIEFTNSMVSASYDGAEMRVCVNAVCNESAESVSASIDAPLVVGSGLVGWIDEMAVWNRALTDAELVNLYNDGAGLAYGEPTSMTIIETVSYGEGGIIVSLLFLSGLQLLSIFLRLGERITGRL